MSETTPPLATKIPGAQFNLSGPLTLHDLTTAFAHIEQRNSNVVSINGRKITLSLVRSLGDLDKTANELWGADLKERIGIPTNTLVWLGARTEGVSDQDLVLHIMLEAS